MAGVLSRFRLDMKGPYCGRGAIYTSAPGHSDWIYEKAPEAIPGGGGCSAFVRRAGLERYLARGAIRASSFSDAPGGELSSSAQLS